MEPTQNANQADGEKHTKRQLRNYLLDRQFQLRWVLRTIIITVIIVTVMGYFLYQTVADASDQILAQQYANPHLTLEAQEAFQRQNAEDKNTTLWILIGWLVGLAALLSVVTIVLTHKTAGPLHKMRRLFATIDGDHLQLWAKLRRGDEVKPVFSEFDAMLLRLRDHRHRDIEELEKIREVMASRSDMQDDLARIDDLLARFRNSVKMD